MLKKGMLILVLLLVAVAAASTRYWVEPDNCSGCGDCDKVCPVNAVEIENGVSHIDPEACIGCGLCQGVCTYDAIH